MGKLGGPIPYPESLQRYLALADVMESWEQPQAILDKIRRVAAQTDTPIPFIYLGGSSGVGKTQTAITVARLV